MTKSFGPNVVLDAVDLSVRPGEIHGLLGQNGSGKSTLVKILTGVYSADDGAITVWGSRALLPITSPGALGISVIHQDIGLVDGMDVFDNVGVTSGYGTRLLAPIKTRRERALLAELMDDLGISLDLDTPVGKLSAAERTFVGILRAMRSLHDKPNTRHLLVLDEPTTSLPAPEAVQVTELMRSISQAGNAVIFISHRLTEVLEVCDRATVLRDGKVVMTRKTSEMTSNELTTAILGRELGAFYPPKTTSTGGVTALSVEDLHGQVVKETSLHVNVGEVLGITGLTGMGQEELPGLLTAESLPTSGRILVRGKPLAPKVSGAIRQGVALIPGNRARDGVWAAATARENITLPVLSRVSRAGTLRRRLEASRAAMIMEQLDVRPCEPERPVSLFSGGNQQKIVIGKWLQTDPQILVLDEPTQGVDAGAKHDILAAILDRATAGAAVIIVSGDHEQLAQICNRVIVFHSGRPIAELCEPDLDEQRLLQHSNRLA